MPVQLANFLLVGAVPDAADRRREAEEHIQGDLHQGVVAFTAEVTAATRHLEAFAEGVAGGGWLGHRLAPVSKPRTVATTSDAAQ